jgi:hypothetical protein
MGGLSKGFERVVVSGGGHIIGGFRTTTLFTVILVPDWSVEDELEEESDEDEDEGFVINEEGRLLDE